MGPYNIEGKVAIVTGGASGMGYEYVVELLRNGVKGVTLVDISTEAGTKALETISQIHGNKRVIFVKADTSNYKEFEHVFRRTVETFSHVDILINNAGLLDDTKWEREVDVNVKGTINGTLLAIEHYIPKYKTDEEGVVLNVSSITGIAPSAGIPVYAATKYAIHGLTVSWGSPLHYERTNIRVVGICPGYTDTPFISNCENRVFKKAYHDILLAEAPPMEIQSPKAVAQYGVELIRKAPTATMWVVEGGEPPYQMEFPDRFKVSRKLLDDAKNGFEV